MVNQGWDGMGEVVFPRKPYDEVESEFIRGEIARGSFDDLEYRRYVNELVWLEWYTNEWNPAGSTGISAFGVSVHRWRIAAKYPEKNDIVRRQLGASARSEDQWEVPAPDVAETFPELARQHRAGWKAVQDGERLDTSRRSAPDTGEETGTPAFLFPVFPYPASQSEFICEEIRRGSFDGIDYRHYVNQLLWIEWYTTDAKKTRKLGPPVWNFKLAALHPDGYDTIRRELGEETRTEMTLDGAVYHGHDDIEAATRRYRRAWQAVE